MLRWCVESVLVLGMSLPASVAQDTPIQNDPRFHEAQQLLDNGDRDGAIALFRALCDEAPDRGDRPLAVASLLVGRERFFWARPFADAARRRSPDNPLGYALLGVCYVNLVQHREAEQLLAKATARFPDDARLHFTRGWAVLERGSVLEAQEHYDRALELEPKNSLYLFMSGENWQRRLRFDEAARMFVAACEGPTPHPDARWRLAQTLGFLERHEEAEQVFRQALREAEQRGQPPHRAQYAMAVYLFEQGRMEDALPLLQRVVTSQPKHRLGWSYLARCQKALGQLEEARESVARYRALQKQEDAEDDASKLRWFIENELIEPPSARPNDESGGSNGPR